MIEAMRGPVKLAVILYRVRVVWLVAVAVVLVSLTAVLGCATNTNHGPDFFFLDFEWRLMAIDAVPVVPGSIVTVEFGDKELHGSGGCNGYRGRYRFDGGDFAAEEMEWTERACPGDSLMVQERRYFDMLEVADTSAIVSGKLLIDGPKGRLVFEPSGTGRNR